MPLIGALPSPVTDQPAVLIIYLSLALIIASAAASIILRNVLFAIGSFAVTMAAVAFLYLMLAPFLLFAVQLLVFTTVSAGLLVGLLRTTSGLDAPLDSPFSPELLGGSAVAAALLALLGVVVGATNWPVKVTGIPGEGFGDTLTNTYVVAIAVVVVMVASAALGAGLLATQRLGRRVVPAAPAAARDGRPRPRRREPRA